MNKNYWCGIRGVYQIWHGQWADPEVRYKNYICNEWDLQESMYITMKDRIADGEDWGDPDNDNDFMNFCKQNADLVKQDIIELSTGGVYESKNIMLRKDKALLESLTKRYGKNNVLNELEHRTVSNAFRKAKKQSRWGQAKTFGDELYGRLNKVVDNLTFVPQFRGINSVDEVIKIFTNEDKNYPMAFLHYDTPGVESLLVITSDKYESDIDKKFLREVLNKFNKATYNNIQYDTEESYLCHVPAEEIEEMIGLYLFDDKKEAREYARTMSLLNNLFGVNMSTDWHDYLEKGHPIDNGFDERGRYIREGYSSKFQIAENWFGNLDFRDLERLTGIFWDDFLNGYDEDDSKEADENFLAACDDWWNENSPSEKVEIMNQWKNGQW